MHLQEPTTPKCTSLHFLRKGKGFEWFWQPQEATDHIFAFFTEHLESSLDERCDHFKGISLLTLNKSILKAAVVHKNMFQGT